MEKPRTMTIRITRELHQKLKLGAVHQDTNMNALVVRACEEFLSTTKSGKKGAA